MIRAPTYEHWLVCGEQYPDKCLERLRPVRRYAERCCRPVLRADQRPRLAAARQEVVVIMMRYRRDFPFPAVYRALPAFLARSLDTRQHYAALEGYGSVEPI